MKKLIIGGDDWPEERIKDIFMKRGCDWTEKERGIVYEYFIKKFLDELINVAFRYIKRGVYNKDQAYELAKEVVDKKVIECFTKYLHSYDPKKYRKYKEKGGTCAFKNWIFGNTIREAVRISKREKRIRENLIRGQKELEEELAQGISNSIFLIELDDIDQFFIDRLELKHIKNMPWDMIEPYLHQLSPKYQDALILIQKQGFSHADAAIKSQFPCTVPAMKTRLCRARQELYMLIKNKTPKAEYDEKFLDKLPTDLRRVYNLIEIKGKTPEEAAPFVGCSKEEIMERLKQVKIELKKLEEGSWEGGEIPCVI